MSENTVVITKEKKSIFLRIKDFFKSSLFKKISTIIAILVFIAMIIRIYQLNEKVSYFNSQLDMHQIIYHDLGGVDLSVQSLQTIDQAFKAGKFNVVQNLDGIKVSGIIVNSTALTYNNPEFEITVNNQKQTFYITSIPSGCQGNFSVFIPNVPIDKARWANITYQKGQVQWRISSY